MCGNDRPRELFATATGLAVTRVPDVARQCCVLRVCTFCQFCLLQPLTLRRCVLYGSKNSSSTSTKGGKRAARYMAHKQAIPDGKIKQASLLNPSTSQIMTQEQQVNDSRIRIMFDHSCSHFSGTGHLACTTYFSSTICCHYSLPSIDNRSLQLQTTQYTEYQTYRSRSAGGKSEAVCTCFWSASYITLTCKCSSRHV